MVPAKVLALATAKLEIPVLLVIWAPEDIVSALMLKAF